MNPPSVAWIVRGNELIFAVLPRILPEKVLGRFHSGIHSAAVRLIEGVYASEPQWALAWLRNRIWTTESAGVASHATVQVAARRVTWQAPRELFERDLRSCSRAREVRPLDEGELPRGDPKAVLVSVHAGLRLAGGRDFLYTRINQARVHRTLHAEVQLVREWLMNPPAGVSPHAAIEIEVSRKCCKMCAAWIFEAFAGRNEFRVIYAADDPGRLARFTALEPGTPQRKLACQKMGLGLEWHMKVVESFIEGPWNTRRKPLVSRQDSS